MDKDESRAVDSTSTALEASVCIGAMADVPILQVMSPTVSTVGNPLVPIETMADMLENKDLRREVERSSRSPRRISSDSKNSVASDGSASRGMRSPNGRRSGSLRASPMKDDENSPSKDDLKRSLEKLVNDTNTALKWKDDQATSALKSYQSDFEMKHAQYAQEVKDVAAVEVAQAMMTERNRAGKIHSSELKEERRVAELTVATHEQLLKGKAAAELQIRESQLKDQAQKLVKEESDRVHEFARLQIDEVQKQAYNVNSAKDEKIAEHILLINQLQLKIQEMQNSEMQQSSHIQEQYLRMQAFQEQ